MTMTPISRLAVLGSAVMLVHSAADAQAVRDSAGVRIITNERPQWDPSQSLRLSASPILTIGDRDGERYELNRVVGASRLADGSVVLANGGSFELRFYDRSGTYRSIAGRRGGGPGEFTRRESLTRLRGDTLAVADQGTIHLFTASGTFVRTLSPRVPPIAGLATTPIVMSVLPGGVRVVTDAVMPQARARGERWIESTHVLIVNAQNVPVHDLGQLPFMQLVMDQNPRPPWFGATGVFANDASTFYYGFGAEYSIRAYTLDGRLSRIVRRRWTPPKVTKADIDAYVVEWGKRWIKTTGAAAEQRYADLRDDPYAPTVPAFSQFVVDDLGRLWVREPHVADAAWAGGLGSVPLAPSTWSVFDANGRWLCDVAMPARFLVKGIGQDYVLGVTRGADDVETVSIYGLVGGVRAP